MNDQYDIAVVGSGIAGAPVAMALSRVGLSVLVVERGAHPRFAIGESTVPETTLGFDHLSRKYDIPELRQISHYFGLKSVGCVAYPKQHFWFGHHRKGQPLDTSQELMMETFPLPMGPDVHLLRADVDAFLVGRLGAYGVDYLDRTEVADFDAGSDDVTLRLRTNDTECTVRARLVVDATGHGSLFGHRLGLRHEQTTLVTRTRSLFGHFEDVEILDDALGGPNPAFIYMRQGGTQHHCFHGGWIWVIPFDNGVCSVGALLDPEVFPLDGDLSPEEELRALIARFPSVEAQLGRMRAIRPVIRTPGRVQFNSRSILGDRVVLTPHSAGFIDPLFSSGISLTNSFIARFVPLAAKALRGGAFDMELFRPLERAFFDELDHTDRVVDTVIRSFRDFELFKQAWRTWTHSTMLRVSMGVGGDMSDLDGARTLILGAADERWRATVEEVRQMLIAGEDTPALELAEQLRAVLDRVSHPFALSKYAVGTKSAVRLGFREIDFPWVVRYLKANPNMAAGYSTVRAMGWVARMGGRAIEHKLEYALSGMRGDEYRRRVDWMRQFLVAERASGSGAQELRSFT